MTTNGFHRRWRFVLHSAVASSLFSAVNISMAASSCFEFAGFSLESTRDSVILRFPQADLSGSSICLPSQRAPQHVHGVSVSAGRILLYFGRRLEDGRRV